MTSRAPETQTTVPVTSRRIVGVDIARCLALLGMMATHILPSIDPSGHVTVIQQIAGGRSAALFATLAGVSLALVTGRTTPFHGQALTAARAGIVARAAVIGVIGLVLASMDSGVAVILVYYAALFVLALPFLRLGWKPLAALAVGWSVVGPVLSQLVRPELTDTSLDQTSLELLFANPPDFVTTVLFNGYYPAVPWLAYIFAGLAVGRLALERVQVAGGLVAVGGALAAGSWGASWLLLHRAGGYEVLERTLPPDSVIARLPLDVSLQHGFYGTTPTTSWWWLAVSAPHSSTPFDLLHTIGTSLAVLGIALVVGRLAPTALGLVFAAGSMTLTVYTLHVSALAAAVGPDRGTALYLWHIGIALVLAALWRATLGQGPFERVAAMAGDSTAAAVRTIT